MRAGWWVAAVLGVVGWAGLARADAILSGSYAGVGTEVFFTNAPPGTQTLTGVPVTGTFFVDATGCLQDLNRPNLCFTTLAGNVAITFQTPQLNGTFTGSAGQISITNGTGSQAVGLTEGYMDPYVYASLTLGGGPNAFAQGIDFQSLAPGAVDLANSSVFLHGGREYGINATLTSVVFNPVPEPASMALLAAAVGTGVARRRNDA